MGNIADMNHMRGTMTTIIHDFPSPVFRLESVGDVTIVWMGGSAQMESNGPFRSPLAMLSSLSRVSNGG